MIYNVLIGGSAGQGMDTVSHLFEKVLQRSGYYVFSNKDYMSRIRGGHNFIQVRFGTEAVHGHQTQVDVILGFNEETLDIHAGKLTDGGHLLADEAISYDSPKFIPLGMNRIAKGLGNPRTMTSVALGYLVKYFGLNRESAHQVLKERFNSLAQINQQAFDQGYDAGSVFKQMPTGTAENQILINGNEAIALGAIAGGLSFYAAYPMTPSTSVMDFLSEKQNAGGFVVEQAEDEISAINMALGASYAGVRAMTGSSGGGLSLMTESLGLAGIMETPLVVVNVQRPGPATGLPTRTEQSDLSFLLTASHGEVPRMIIAVRNPEDAFYQTVRALNLADRYQMLVILMNDQYLADYKKTVPAFDFSRLTIERNLADGSHLAAGELYRRYKLTEDGLSPRLIPGAVKGQIVITDSDEHDEFGHITESDTMRVAMMNKRMNRLTLIKKELQEPNHYGHESPDYLLVGWGSTEGPIAEATALLAAEGHSVGALVFGDVYPLPEEKLMKMSASARKVINIEQNFTGQLGKLIRQETGIKCDASLLKYDGRQISAMEIVNRFKNEVMSHA